MRNHSINIALILVAALILLAFGLGHVPLIDRDETRYSVMAKTMMENHDWVVSYLNQKSHLDKPPFLVWLLAISFKLFGFSELSARIIPMLMAIGTLLSTYWLGCRLWNPRTGLMAAFILMSSMLFFFLSRMVVTDMTLTFFSTLVVAAFIEGVQSNRRAYYFLGYIAFGGAMLTKGPVGIVLPGLVVLMYLWKSGNLQKIRQMYLVWGIVIILCIAMPWYLLANQRIPGYLYFFFIRENLMRFLTKVHQRSQPFYFFIPVVLGGMFPWILFLIQSLRPSKDGWRWWQDTSRYFCFSWFLIGFIFFSLSKAKLPTYILPYFVPLGLLLAHYWEENLATGQIRYRVLGILSIVLGAVILAAGFIVPASKFPDEVRHILSWPLYSESFLLLALGIIPWVLLKYQRAIWAFGSIVVISMGLLIHVAVFDEIPRFATYHSTKGMMAVLSPMLQPSDKVFVQNEHRWSVECYLPAGTKVRYVDEFKEIESDLATPGNNYVVLKREKDLDILKLHFPGDLKILAKEGEQCLVTCQP